MGGRNCRNVAGNMRSEEAKIGGITPAVLTFSGRWESCAPCTCDPTILLPYCIGIRLSARSTKRINTMHASMIIPTSNKLPIPSSPATTSLPTLMMAEGMPATIPAKIINEVPFPTPLSDIRSPIHMTNIEPVATVTAVKRRNPIPPPGTTGTPAGDIICSKPMLIPNPWKNASASVA
jgi:hypothetical protein